jgi:hypothetical protein
LELSHQILEKKRKSKKYPVKKVDSIIRIKKADGSEWLKGRQTWIGLDRLGNDIPKTFVDPELYDRPVFSYQSKLVNQKDVFGKTERKAVSVTYEQDLLCLSLQKTWNNYTQHVLILPIVKLSFWL